MSEIKALRDIKDWTDPANRVEYLRVTFKYPIKEFAKKTGSYPETMEAIINKGKVPSHPHMQNISRMLPVRKTWVFGGHGEPFLAGAKLDSYMFDPESGLNKAMKYGNELRGKKFKKIRQEHGLSQVLFADKLGTSRDTVAAIENGRQEVPLYLMELLHWKFNVDLNWMICDTGKDWRFSDDISEAEKDEERRGLLARLDELDN